MNTPAEIAQVLVGVGKTKSSLSSVKMLGLGILAGMFIALAGAATSSAACSIEAASVSKLVSALLFPGGLALVILAGSELFTGNCLIVMSVLEKQARLSGMLRNWLFVFIGNAIGSLLVAWLVSASGTYGLYANGFAVATIKTAIAKSSLAFDKALILGILCNFLVCIAVWASFAGKTPVDKFIALYFPIMFFVISGFEHSIANMYYGPAGLFAMGNPVYAQAAIDAGLNTAALTWGNFLTNNLIPVTIGNIIGGVLPAGVMYWAIYLKKGKKAA